MSKLKNKTKQNPLCVTGGLTPTAASEFSPRATWLRTTRAEHEKGRDVRHRAFYDTGLVHSAPLFTTHENRFFEINLT